jgi:hypothetical protein
MFFVHLRAKSIGENAKLTFTCGNIPDPEANTVCGHETEFAVNLNKLEYIVPDNHTNKITLTNKVGIVLKYPTIAIANEDFSDPYKGTIKLFADNIDYLYDEESVYPRKELTLEELEEFFDSLTADQLEQIRQFFVTTPKVALKDKIVCGKCKFEHELVVENLYSFFT